MNILKKENTRKCYLINDTGAGKYMLCKILNEYDNREDAKDSLVSLLTRKRTEKEILKDYNTKGL